MGKQYDGFCGFGAGFACVVDHVVSGSEIKAEDAVECVRKDSRLCT